MLFPWLAGVRLSRLHLRELPEGKIAEIDYVIYDQKRGQERKTMYEKLIAQGDEALETKNYESALRFYEDALGVDPNSNYAREQIRICKNKITDFESLSL